MDINDRLEKNIFKRETRDEIRTGLDIAVKTINEGGLGRLVSATNDESRDFAIITAYRKVDGNEASVEENVLKNKELRNGIKTNKLGIRPVIGRCQDSYDPEHVEERSYFVLKREDMSSDTFINTMLDLAQHYKQDGIILVSGKYRGFVQPNGVEVTRFKSRGISNIDIKDIGDMYSEYVRKLNPSVKFKFEGIETPNNMYMVEEFRKQGFE